jgi:hypothetical protein
MKCKKLSRVMRKFSNKLARGGSVSISTKKNTCQDTKDLQSIVISLYALSLCGKQYSN